MKAFKIVSDGSVEKIKIKRIHKITSKAYTKLKSFLGYEMEVLPSITIFISKNTDHILSYLKLQLNIDNLLKTRLLEEKGSFAIYSNMEQPIIVLYFDEKEAPSLGDNQALTSIIAHEIMHVVHAKRGYDKKVTTKIIKCWDILITIQEKVEALFQKKIPAEKIKNNMLKIAFTTGFIIKDLLILNELMNISFSNAIFQNYNLTIATKKKYTGANIESIERRLKESIRMGDLAFFTDIFCAWLGLSVMWMCFRILQMDQKADILSKKIYNMFFIPLEIKEAISSISAKYKQISFGDLNEIIPLISDIYENYYKILKKYVQ